MQRTKNQVLGKIYDLAVLPKLQNIGIGKELVQRCINACGSSEWLVQTDKAKGFYEKIGFKENAGAYKGKVVKPFVITAANTTVTIKPISAKAISYSKIRE